MNLQPVQHEAGMGARLKKLLSSGMFQGLLLVALVYAAPFAWKAEWFQALFFPVQFHEKKTRDLQNAYRAYALQLRNCPMVRNRAEVDIALDQKKNAALWRRPRQSPAGRRSAGATEKPHLPAPL